MGHGSIYVPRLGEVVLLDRFRGADGFPPPVQSFEPEALRRWERVARHLRRGGVAAVTGDWEAIVGLYERLEQAAPGWVASPGEPRRPAARGGRDRLTRRDWERLRREALDRLVVPVRGDAVIGVTPPVAVPGLLDFAGGAGGAASPPGPGDLVLVPVAEVRRAQAALETTYPVHALGGAVICHDAVLAPRSQETLWCIRRAVEACRPRLPRGATVLDMGCGSGCCALLAARLLDGLAPRVVATDHLPQAIATTRANVARFEAAGLVPPGSIRVTAGGDLFAPVAAGPTEPAAFDLIVFNAPWVVAPARTPEETATNDPGQRTLRRFLAEAPGYLSPGGRVIVGYASNGGPRAMAGLEAAARAAGFCVEAVFSDRIPTHRRRRRWQRVYAYVLAPRGNRNPGKGPPGMKDGVHPEIPLAEG